MGGCGVAVHPLIFKKCGHQRGRCDIYSCHIIVSVLKLQLGKKKIYIFNVYLPYDKKDTEEVYLDRLTKLHNLVAECDSTCITIVGDYNANIQKDANFAMLLKGFCDQFKYIWTSYNKLPKDTYTYVSDAWGSHSSLDHSISTEDGNNIITNMRVL